MTHYRAYGFAIVSEITLPELQAISEASCAPNLHVRLGKSELPSARVQWVFRAELPGCEPWLSCGRTPDGYLIRLPGIADFSVTRDGREIVCCPTTMDDDRDRLRHLLLDVVIPLTSKLRGREALHATAVLTPRGVCAFIGPTGSGKSTVAACFLKAGYPVIADDCLLVYSRGRGIHAVPGYPGIRLCEDTFAALHASDGQCRRVGGHTTKLRWAPHAAVKSFSNDAQPLKRIYRLMRSQDADGTHVIPPSRLEPLSTRAAFMELVDATFRLDAVDRDMLTREFRFWERAALTVPMRRLWLDDDLNSLNAREAVLRDLVFGAKSQPRGAGYPTRGRSASTALANNRPRS